MGEITAEPTGSGIIIRLAGALFRDSLPILEDTWKEKVSEDPSYIAFNCAGLSQIDSSVIGTMVKFQKFSQELGFDLVFYDIKPNIRQLFTVTGIDRFITIMTLEKFRDRYLEPA